MSTIPVPNAVRAWPRSALITFAALLAVIAVTLTLALGAIGRTTTRTVVRLAPASDQSNACRMGRPC